jgi:hypothetical protein
MTRPEGNIHFDVFIQPSENSNHPIKRKALKARIADARKL